MSGVYRHDGGRDLIVIRIKYLIEVTEVFSITTGKWLWMVPHHFRGVIHMANPKENTQKGFRSSTVETNG